MGAPHIEKKCGDCQLVKSVSEFYRTSQAHHRGRDGYCKVCRRRRDRDRREKSITNRQKQQRGDPLYFRRRKLVKLYGITQEQWEEMYRAQGGVCAICGKSETRILYGEIARLATDHNHATKKVRALLCCRCNAALGVVENTTLLRQLFSYLCKYETPSAEYVQAAHDVQTWIAEHGGPA